MKRGHEVWIKAVVLDVSETAGVRLAVGEYGCQVWIAKSKCQPVEPEAVAKVEYPEGVNAIFMVPNHSRHGTIGTAILKGESWFFKSLDQQFLTWCRPSELKFLNREPETVVKQSLTSQTNSSEIPNSSSDPVNPSHYRQGPAETIDIIEAAIAKAPNNKAAGLHWQVLKYVLRCWFKNGFEDLKKAKWYLDRLIQEEEAK
jgi:hypothetical protein